MELKLGSQGDERGEMMRLVGDACKAYAAKRVREAADLLCAAEKVATHGGMFREAAKVRQAIGILAHGGKPRLLVRGAGYLEGK